MVSRELFTEGIKLQVAGYGGAAAVRLQTWNGVEQTDYLVRDIIQTFETSVMLNVWTGSTGHSPIISASSDAFDFEPGFPTDYIGITISFDTITFVKVIPWQRDRGRFH